jgi:peroxiredoxin
VVLIAFWASWCETCADLLPQLDAWQARYRKRGLRVLGISTDNRARTRLALERWSVRHAVGIDPTESSTSAYGAYMLPIVYVVDRKGLIREVVMDYDPSQRGRSEKLIEKLLAER